MNKAILVITILCALVLGAFLCSITIGRFAPNSNFSELRAIEILSTAILIVATILGAIITYILNERSTASQYKIHRKIAYIDRWLEKLDKADEAIRTFANNGQKEYQKRFLYLYDKMSSELFTLLDRKIIVVENPNDLKNLCHQYKGEGSLIDPDKFHDLNLGMLETYRSSIWTKLIEIQQSSD